MLVKCSKELLERETICGEEFAALLRGEDLPPMPPKIKVTKASLKTKNPKMVLAEDLAALEQEFDKPIVTGG